MIKPMLAYEYYKHKDKVVYPCYVQPKIDGIRCIAEVIDGQVSLYTRTGKLITSLPHINKALSKVKNCTLDGELYTYSFDFETLSGLVRRKVADHNAVYIKFLVFDCIGLDISFIGRTAYLVDKLRTSKYIQLINTFICRDEMHVFFRHDLFKEEGYEGTMIRNTNSLYKHGRSFDLLKLKDMQDAEYQIANVIEGKGKYKGCAIFVCLTSEGKTFKVKAKGTFEKQRAYLLDINNLIGKMITVQFQELTKFNIPRFPIGLRIRGEE